uniref:protein-tyrosine-phosphatase n=1 Tax=Loxodonta africana TaxID=9785 RepID=G3U749_LOXAF
MRPPILVAALLWLPGIWAEVDACHSLEGHLEESGGLLPKVNVSSQGRPTSLFVSWEAPEPGGPGHTLWLIRLSPLGSPEGRQLQVHTNASSFEFKDLVPGSRYRLEVTALRPCAQNATITLTTHTAPATVRDLQLQSSGSPSSLEASWGAAPGEQDGYQLLLYHLESQTLAHNISMPPGTRSYRFGNLLPGNEYVLEVTTWASNLQAKTSIHQWTAPVSLDHLQLHAMGTGALRASWNVSEGAAWLHLSLTDLPGGTSLTVVVEPGVSNYTFLHLSPGTPYQLTLTAAVGPHQATGPNTTATATEWTYPSAPLELVLTPQPPELWASWKAGPGARDGYLLRLSGPVERNVTLGPGDLSATFPGPLPAGHYALELKVLAGPYDAWAQASAWLDDSEAQPTQGHDATLQLEGLEATREPGRRALLYAEGTPGLLGNISVPSGATQITFCGLVPGACYRVNIASARGVITQSLMGHTRPLAPQSLEVISRVSPSELAISWAPPTGQREGYRVTWDQEGSQKSLGSPIDLGPDNSSLALQALVPGSCYTVSVWAWAGSLNSSIRRTHACTVPAPPANLSLGLASQPHALMASWSPPPGVRDGFRLQLYCLRPLTLVVEETLTPEAQNFSWAQLSPGSKFLVQLATLRGPDESSSANATGWTTPFTPPLVNVTSEGPTQLRTSWVHAPGGRDSYQVTLYQAGVWVGTSTLGPEVDSTSFSALTPGTKYEVEVVSKAGPLRAVAANAFGWTSPLLPSELLVSMQAGSAVVNLAWASSPLGQGVCHAQLSEAGISEQPLVLGQAHLVLRGLTPGTFSLSVLCQAGPLQASTHSVVLPVEPDPVEDVQCQPEATHLVLNWTVPTGDVGTCLVVVEQLAVGGNAHIVFQANTSGDAVLLSSLVPATSYRLSLTVLGRNGLWSRAVTLVCATSAEAWHPPELAMAPQLKHESEMGVVITPGMFGKDDGQIQWYGVIATTDMSLARPPQEAINHTWYDHYYRGRDSYLAILLPNPFYPGPWAVPRIWMVPVGTEDCGQTQEICNGQLKPGAQYRFSVAAFTRSSPPEPIISFSAFSALSRYSRVARPSTRMPGMGVGSLGLPPTVLFALCRAQKNQFSQELTAYNLRRTHRPIPIQSFRQSYEAKSAHGHQAFFQEFEELKEVGKEQPRLEAEHPANATKNRYPHVLPYDHSRVRLAQLEGEPHSDYINANFIPGYTNPQEFIATQGPLKKTLEDFWRLVWEQQVHIIVMLTVGMENGRVLCEHYWPADSIPITHGHITVHLLAAQSLIMLVLEQQGVGWGESRKERQVQQLQFPSWEPGRELPATTLLPFLVAVGQCCSRGKSKKPGTLLSHSSKGVAQLGIFLAMEQLLQQAGAECTVDVFN